MDEYSQAKQHYEIATVRAQMEKQEAVRVQEIQRQQAYAQQQKQVHDVRNYVQKSHGLSPEQANEFITSMASPKSITMDNLVQLWRLRQGQGTPTGAPAQAQPSSAFQQEKRAASVPSPMGVMPSAGGSNDGRSATDQIMDTMIGDFNSKNPWGK